MWSIGCPCTMGRYERGHLFSFHRTQGVPACRLRSRLLGWPEGPLGGLAGMGPSTRGQVQQLGDPGALQRLFLLRVWVLFC